jgi:hypothetical protein
MKRGPKDLRARQPLSKALRGLAKSKKSTFKQGSDIMKKGPKDLRGRQPLSKALKGLAKSKQTH